MDFQNTLGPWMGRTMKLMDILFMDSFKAIGLDLSKQQWLLLKILSDDDGQVQNDLAFITNRDKASLTRLITGMEKKNLVARIPSKTDKRINHIHLTKKGITTFNETLPIVENIIEQVQEPLSTQEINQTILILKKIHTNLLTKTNGCASN